MLNFAFVYTLPEGEADLSHRGIPSQDEVNRDDGYLSGLDELARVMQTVVEELKSSQATVKREKSELTQEKSRLSKFVDWEEDSTRSLN